MPGGVAGEGQPPLCRSTRGNTLKSELLFSKFNAPTSVSTSTRGGGLKKSVGRSKRHVQMITRPPKGGQPGYIPVRASSFWSSFS